jgi:hypothetical protein
VAPVNARRAWHGHIAGLPDTALKGNDAEPEKASAAMAAPAAGWDRAGHFGGIEVTRKY